MVMFASKVTALVMQLSMNVSGVFEEAWPEWQSLSALDAQQVSKMMLVVVWTRNDGV